MQIDEGKFDQHKVFLNPRKKQKKLDKKTIFNVFKMLTQLLSASTWQSPNPSGQVVPLLTYPVLKDL
jgi:hypothetical protein